MRYFKQSFYPPPPPEKPLKIQSFKDFFTFYKILFCTKFYRKFSFADLFKNFSKESFFIFLSFLSLFFLLHCKPKIKDKEDDKKTPSYSITFFLTIDNRDNQNEQKKYSFSVEEGSKFSKQQLDKLQQDFLDANSTGYDFDGWYEDENFSSEKITAEKLAAISISKAKNFYGKLTIKQYKITFETGAESSTVDPITVNHGKKITAPNNPTKAGWNFANWYKENNFKTVFDFERGTTQNLTLYALFGKAPTQITLSANTIDENKAIATVIATLTTTDATVGDSFTYSLVAGNGDDDNGSFSIDGDKLKSAKIFDFESKNSYKIRLKTTDSIGLSLEKELTITVNDLVEFSYSYSSSINRFYEEPNDGTVSQSVLLNINVNGDSFIAAPTAITGVAHKKYNVNTHYTVANVPAGLTLEVRRSTDPGNLPYILFTGKATAHAAANSVSDVTITFKSAILQNNSDLSDVSSKTKNDILISFDLEFFIKSSDVTFQEIKEYGSGRFSKVDSSDYATVVSGGETVDTGNAQFNKNIIASPVLGTHFTVNGLPANLTLQFVRTNKALIFWFSGAAVNHANSDDTTFTITFDKSIFADPPASNDDILGRVQTYKIDFVD